MSGVGSQIEFLVRVPLLKVVLMILFRQYNCVVESVKCSIDFDDDFVVITFKNYDNIFQFVLRMTDKIITRVTLSQIPYPGKTPIERFGDWIKILGITHKACHPPFLFTDRHNSVEYDVEVENFYNSIRMTPSNYELLKLMDSMYLTMKTTTFDSVRIFSDEFIEMVKTIVTTLSSF